MNILIIEDEELAIETLERQLNRLGRPFEVVARLDTVREAVAWLNTHPAPDLAFVDIQLADGLSFEIFEQVRVRFPVIFVTAYDAYALRAFKVNSIDYLLKPVELAALEAAFDKLETLKQPVAAPEPALDLRTIQQLLSRTVPKYKTRFMVKIGDKMTAFTTEDVDYFYGEHKTVWMKMKSGRKYVVDYTLEELVDLLDPEQFFRLNRSVLATFSAIEEAVAYSNSRLKIILKQPIDQEDILVSREKAEEFRLWWGK